MFKSHLFTSQFWKDDWIALRRSRRDIRDRKAFLLATLWLLFAAVYYGGFLWNLRAALDTGTGILLLIFSLVLLVTFGGRWLFSGRDTRQGRRESMRSVDRDLHAPLASDGFALAVLLARRRNQSTAVRSNACAACDGFSG